MSFLPGLSDVLEVVGGPLIGGLMSNQGAQQANSASAAMSREQMDWSSAEAQKQKDWEERMSSSAYQRAMLDMKKAGLNPILASKTGGASTPGSNLPSAQLPQFQNTWAGAGNAVNSAISAYKTRSDVQLQNSMQELNSAKTSYTSAQVDLAKAQTDLAKAQTKLNIENVNLSQADQNVKKAEVVLKQSQTQLNMVNTRFKSALIPAAEATATVAKNVRDLIQAVDEIVGMNKQGYKEVITDVKNQIQGWIGTFKMNYKEGTARLKKEIEESSNIGNAVKAWVRNVIDW